MPATRDATARAAVTGVDGRTEVRQLPVPVPAGDTGLLMVEGSGVCGTDISLARNRKLAQATILGHHVVGRIAAIGAAAARRWHVAEGDRVAVQEYLPCRQCEWCRRGEFRFCDRADFWHQGRRLGLIPVDEQPSLWGGNAEYMHLPPEAIVHPLPSAVTVDRAAWVLPLANAFDWTLEAARLQPDETVVIFGPGQHGIACAVAARAAGAGEVTVVGTSADGTRLKIAQRVGAHTIVLDADSDPSNHVELQRLRTGADVIVNTVGDSGALLPTMVDLAGKRGRVVHAGIAMDARPDLDLTALGSRGLSVIGARGRSLDAVGRAIDSLGVGSGPHPLDEVDTLRITLDELDALLSPGNDVANNERPMHVVVRPS